MKYGTTTIKSNVRFFLCGIVVSLYIDSKIILHRPSGAVGAKGASVPSKFSADAPFFADKSFKCGLFGRSNYKYT